MPDAVIHVSPRDLRGSLALAGMLLVTTLLARAAGSRTRRANGARPDPV